MKKIVILATKVGVINRGAETFVVEMVKKLKDFYNIEVYSKGIHKDIEEFITKVDVKIPKIFKLHQYLYNNLKYFQKVCDKTHYLVPSVIEQYYFNKVVYDKYLKNRADIDLIYPNNGIWGVKVALKVRANYGTPFIYTGHGGIGAGEKLILKTNPDMYIAINNDALKWAKHYSNNVIEIPNGVDLNSFNIKSINTKTNKNLQVLCVGAFVEFKRQKLLIDAMHKLGYGNLVLLGSGELKNELSKYGNKYLRNRFSIHSVSYNKVIEYYQQATVFSLPSRDEPFGIVYLEAMAMNLPIVATNDKTRRDIIGDCGILCDVNNSIEYANAIEQCHKINYDNKPRQRVEKYFSWDLSVKKYREVINGLTIP
jgi:glycosyltransferase involved in cell wall biosynthesis